MYRVGTCQASNQPEGSCLQHPTAVLSQIRRSTPSEEQDCSVMGSKPGPSGYPKRLPQQYSADRHGKQTHRSHHQQNGSLEMTVDRGPLKISPGAAHILMLIIISFAFAYMNPNGPEVFLFPKFSSFWIGACVFIVIITWLTKGEFRKYWWRAKPWKSEIGEWFVRKVFSEKETKKCSRISLSNLYDSDVCKHHDYLCVHCSWVAARKLFAQCWRNIICNLFMGRLVLGLVISSTSRSFGIAQDLLD